jgi:hypothetical protein
MVHRFFGQVKLEKKPETNLETLKIALFEISLTHTRVAVHKSLFEHNSFRT